MSLFFRRHSFTSKYKTAESHGPVLVWNFHLKGLLCEILKEGSSIGVFFYFHKHSCLSHAFLVPWKLRYRLTRAMLLTPLWPINAEVQLLGVLARHQPLRVCTGFDRVKNVWILQQQTCFYCITLSADLFHCLLSPCRSCFNIINVGMYIQAKWKALIVLFIMCQWKCNYWMEQSINGTFHSTS